LRLNGQAAFAEACTANLGLLDKVENVKVEPPQVVRKKRNYFERKTNLCFFVQVHHQFSDVGLGGAASSLHVSAARTNSPSPREAREPPALPTTSSKSILNLLPVRKDSARKSYGDKNEVRERANSGGSLIATDVVLKRRKSSDKNSPVSPKPE
jgi:hypothetical protein